MIETSTHLLEDVMSACKYRYYYPQFPHHPSSPTLRLVVIQFRGKLLQLQLVKMVQFVGFDLLYLRL